MGTLMEMETEMIENVKDYADEGSSIASNEVRDWRNSDDISHEADTEVFETPSCSPDEDSCTTTASTESSEPVNDSKKLFKFELSDNDVKDLNKSVAEGGEGHQLPLPNEVAYTEKKEIPSEEEIIASPDNENKDSTQSDQIIYFVNQDAKISPLPVLQYVLDINQPFDTVISCADGKIGAHRLVLASASPFIGDMFCSQDHRLGEVAMLVLPDVQLQTMKALLNFCYTGSMFFPKENEKEIVETMQLLLLGEFGNLSMKEVTVKVPPPQAAIPDAEPQPGTSSSSSGGVGTSGSLDAQTESLVDLLSSSEDEDEAENDSKDLSSEDEDDEDKQASRKRSAAPIQDDELERLDLANNYLKYKKDEDTSINYFIPPRPAGVKTKKLQCFHCPGAFKSMETLTNHLDNNHGIFLQSRNLNKSEFKNLTNCGYCNIEHKLIQSANSCISGHGRTRCYVCFEIVRNRDFEEHVKTSHGKEKRNGMCIVKCRWCDAGILLQDPIDNKPMSGHCFANHFPGGRNTKVTMMDLEEECVKPESPNSIEFPPPSSVSNTPSTHDFKLPKVPSTLSTPTTNSSSSKMTNKNVPAVLALLHKASLKRKHLQETESESEQIIHNPINADNPNKRARLDANGKRLQVAKRTGKPVGPHVYLESLRNGIPSMKTQTTTRNKGTKVKMVSLDVTKLPKIFVNINYPKTFILKSLSNDKENCSPTGTSVNDSNCSVAEPSAEKQVVLLNTSDVSTEEARTPETKRRHSDSRCSLPLL